MHLHLVYLSINSLCPNFLACQLELGPLAEVSWTMIWMPMCGGGPQPEFRVSPNPRVWGEIGMLPSPSHLRSAYAA